MDIYNAVTILGALSQETRLRTFRLLIEAGPDGLPATEIANKLSVRTNLMSTHLRVLAQSGLTRVRRDGRRIIHAVDLDATRALIAFLIEDCCQGETQRCASLLDDVLPLTACGAGNRQREASA